MAPTRRCSKCLVVKEISEFNLRGPRPSGEMKYNSECKKCNAVRTLAYYHSNSEYKQRTIRLGRSRKVRKIYGISYAEYQEKAIAQGPQCAICSREVTLHLDHCHTTGKVRDFICIHCNRMLGWANDDPEYLIKMARYLEKHRRLS